MSERRFGETPDDWAKRVVKQVAKDWSEPPATPETIHISLPALRAVILGVIDDGDPLLTGLPWQIDRPMPDIANDARLRFCDEIERRLRQLPARG